MLDARDHWWAVEARLRWMTWFTLLLAVSLWACGEASLPPAPADVAVSGRRRCGMVGASQRPGRPRWWAGI